MTSKGKQHDKGPESTAAGTGIHRPSDPKQLDFEIGFFADILERHPNYVDVLRVMGNNLTLKKQYKEGLEIDRRLVRLRPEDALAHYNLACSYALLRRAESAIKALQKAVELGYRDFCYMRQDRDLDSIRSDPRYRKLLREYEDR